MSVPEFLDDDRLAVRLMRTCDAPVHRVWRAVSDPVELQKWFPGEMSFEPVPGAPIRFDQDGTETAGTVLAFEPDLRFAFTWGEDELEFAVSPDPEGTRVTLTHAFDDLAGAASFATGWETCLEYLAAHDAGGEPPAPGRRVARHEELISHFRLDRPVITRNNAGWSVLWERQMVAPAEVIWKAFFGEGRTAPEVGAPFHPGGAPEVTLGTVTRMEPNVRIEFDTADGEPGDRVRLHLGTGTGHGARLFLNVAGTDLDEIEPAIDQWGDGAIAHLAREALLSNDA